LIVIVIDYIDIWIDRIWLNPSHKVLM